IDIKIVSRLSHSPYLDAFQNDIVSRLVIEIRSHATDVEHDICSAGQLAKNGVVIVEARLWGERNEKLGAIRVGARIRHAEDTSGSVPQGRRKFIQKIVARPVCAQSIWRAALNDKSSYHPMEF